MKYLYKYKSGDTKNIDALQNNSLWVSTYESMNDPMECPIYITDPSIKDEEFDEYKEKMISSFCCASFSISPTVKRLWNYYTDGFKGIVIAYAYQDIVEALNENKINNYTEGHVVYDGTKYDICKNDIERKIMPDREVFFHKDDSWEKEKEYRFVFEYNKNKSFFYSDNGFLLKNIRPHHIFIGYKSIKANKTKLIDYCRNNNICLYEIKPNNRSINCSDYNKKVLVSKEKEGSIFPSTIN